ncbi:MAG TPA: hypothetical protein VFX30_15195, partial [bacterium]|nr:hypothetical protein [bacterium]
MTGVDNGDNTLPAITYDRATGTFRFADPNAIDLGTGLATGNQLVGTRLFGNAGPSASDFLGNTLPLIQIERRPDQNTSPSSALSIRLDGAGRVTVADDYRPTVDAGLRALTRLNEIRQLAANPATTNEQLTTALAEVPALLATYRRAAERIRDVNTMSGMSVYQAIDTWTNQVHQSNTRVLDGVIIGFNMQNLNGRDTSYQSGTAFMELIGHFGPVV